MLLITVSKVLPGPKSLTITFLGYLSQLLRKAWSHFVSISYGESWDSSCKESWVPVHNQWVPVNCSKKLGVRNWKCLGLYVTRQWIWRQTTILFITNECLTEKPSGMCDTCISIAYKVIFSKEMSKRMYIRPNSNETEIDIQSFWLNSA